MRDKLIVRRGMQFAEKTHNLCDQLQETERHILYQYDINSLSIHALINIIFTIITKQRIKEDSLL